MAQDVLDPITTKTTPPLLPWRERVSGTGGGDRETAPLPERVRGKCSVGPGGRLDLRRCPWWVQWFDSCFIYDLVRKRTIRM